jgi:F420-0:gamma-glutamyl ligase
MPLLQHVSRKVAIMTSDEAGRPKETGEIHIAVPPSKGDRLSL